MSLSAWGTKGLGLMPWSAWSTHLHGALRRMELLVSLPEWRTWNVRVMRVPICVRAEWDGVRFVSLLRGAVEPQVSHM